MSSEAQNSPSQQPEEEIAFDNFAIYGVEILLEEAARKMVRGRPLVAVLTGNAASGKTTGARMVSEIFSNSISQLTQPYKPTILPSNVQATANELIVKGIVATDFFFVERTSPLRQSTSLESWWRRKDFEQAMRNLGRAIVTNQSAISLYDCYNRVTGELEYVLEGATLLVKSPVIIEGIFAHRAIPILNEYDIKPLHIHLIANEQEALERFLTRVRTTKHRSVEDQRAHYYEQMMPLWEILKEEIATLGYDLLWVSLPKNTGVLLHKPPSTSDLPGGAEGNRTPA